MEVRNYIEDILNEVLTTVLSKRNDICKCEQCIAEIKEYTLKRLSPKYVDSLDATMETRTQTVDNQIKADVTREITLAIDYIKNNNSH